MKFIWFAAVGRGGEHYQMLPRLVRDIRDQRVSLLLSLGRPNRSGTGMDLVNNDQFRAFVDKDVPPNVGLNEVDRDDLIGVVAVYTDVALDLAVESGLSVGADDHGIQPQLVLDFRLPLIAQMR